MNVLEEEVYKTDEINGCLPADRLRSIIERIEMLEDKKSVISSDIRDVFAEAKSVGFDVKALRTVLKLRKMNPDDRNEQDYMVEAYRKALEL